MGILMIYTYANALRTGTDNKIIIVKNLSDKKIDIITVKRIGDFNNDGYDDLIVSTDDKTLVIYGNKNSISNIDLKELDISQWVLLSNNNLSVRPAGDINHDGFDDIMILSSTLTPNKDSLTILYGNKHLNNIDIYKLTPEQGFVIEGNIWEFNPIGDVNGDGYDDIIIGDLFPSNSTGFVSVIYGGLNLTNINLDNLPLDRGIKIIGSNNHRIGGIVSGIGDINHDGYSDFAIGSEHGASYLIFGGENLNNIDLTFFAENQGLIIVGQDNLTFFSHSIIGIGDVNHDGFADVIIEIPRLEHIDDNKDKESYIIYGDKYCERYYGINDNEKFINIIDLNLLPIITKYRNTKNKNSHINFTHQDDYDEFFGSAENDFKKQNDLTWHDVQINDNNYQQHEEENFIMGMAELNTKSGKVLVIFE
jgi:hypothetical protein